MAPTGFCLLLLTLVGPYWLLLAPTGPCWLLLTPVGSYWLLLAPTNSFWLLLALVGSYWLFLTHTRSCWRLCLPFVHTSLFRCQPYLISRTSTNVPQKIPHSMLVLHQLYTNACTSPCRGDHDSLSYLINCSSPIISADSASPAPPHNKCLSRDTDKRVNTDQ